MIAFFDFELRKIFFLQNCFALQGEIILLDFEDENFNAYYRIHEIFSKKDRK